MCYSLVLSKVTVLYQPGAWEEKRGAAMQRGQVNHAPVLQSSRYRSVAAVRSCADRIELEDYASRPDRLCEYVFIR